jgi:hypothetical protein
MRRVSSWLRSSFFFSTIALAIGCGGSESGGGPASTNDTGASDDTGTIVVDDSDVDTTPDDTTPPSDAGDETDAAPLDHGAPSTTYPAFVPAMGEIRDNGGGVLANPVIVTVTWPGDPDVDALEAFGDGIGDTKYWAAIGGDYAVGKASSGASNHVRLTTAAPATWADSEIDAWVSDHAAHPGKDGFPAPTDQTIYVLYVPDSTSITYSGSDMCSQGIGGYHTNTSILVTGGGSKDVAYAIVGTCGGTISDRTSTGSHELIEASTDPHPQDIAGYYGFTPETAAWDLYNAFQSEVADACENGFGNYYTDTEGTFAAAVQRSWSNSSGKAGHNPCVPVASGVYYNTTPLALEPVTVDLSSVGGDSIVRANGIHIKKGETKTFPIGFYSDADTGGPWTVTLLDGSPLKPTAPARLKMSIDKSSGQNGEKAWITVTVLSTDATRADIVTVRSKLGTSKGAHSFPILIGSE